MPFLEGSRVCPAQSKYWRRACICWSSWRGSLRGLRIGVRSSTFWGAVEVLSKVKLEWRFRFPYLRQAWGVIVVGLCIALWRSKSMENGKLEWELWVSDEQANVVEEDSYLKVVECSHIHYHLNMKRQLRSMDSWKLNRDELAFVCWSGRIKKVLLHWALFPFGDAKERLTQG